MKKLFVGNLSFGATEDTIRSLFENHGTVESVSLITDRDTGRSKGFGFVEMTNDAEAARAIAAVNGKEIDGRALTVNEARPKTDRPAVAAADAIAGSAAICGSPDPQAHKRTPMKNIYIANLSFGTTEQTVRSLFEAYGTVDRVSIVTDRDTGQPKGFGFVEMPNDAEAEKPLPASMARMWVDGRWRSTKPVRKRIGPAAVAGVAPAAGIASIVRRPSPIPTVRYLPRTAAETVRRVAPQASRVCHPICRVI